jgi:hypothetical protein
MAAKLLVRGKTPLLSMVGYGKSPLQARKKIDWPLGNRYKHLALKRDKL